MITYLFEKEIRVFGMRRSGNTAVNNFIIKSFPKDVVSVISNSDLSFRKHSSKKKNPFKVSDVTKYFLTGVEHMPIIDIGVCLKSRYSYDWERRRWARYYGKNGFGKDLYNLVIIRSPHNLLASVLKYPRSRMKYIFTGGESAGKDYLEFTQLWIQYAEEVLDITNHVPDKIVVLFDKFVSDGYYRKSISDALGIPYVYSAINSAIYGVRYSKGAPGSSFDEDKYAGRAKEMKVLDRWKYLIDPGEEVWWTLDKCKKKLFHPKIVGYTKAIFDIDLEEIFE